MAKRASQRRCKKRTDEEVRSLESRGIEYPPFCTGCHLSRDCSRWPAGHCLPNAIAPTSVCLRGDVTVGRPGVLLPAFTHHRAGADQGAHVGWSSLCCTWPRGTLARAAAHLAVSVGWLTPRRVRVGRVWGSSSNATGGTGAPATPGSPDFPELLRRRLPIPRISRGRLAIIGAEGEI